MTFLLRLALNALPALRNADRRSRLDRTNTSETLGQLAAGRHSGIRHHTPDPQDLPRHQIR
jgi:hypothetical protein